VNISIEAIQEAKLYNIAPANILYHWTRFCEYATLMGISLADGEDWFDWWKVYIYGVGMEAGRE
jgi:hypothetical protein